jgi:hypothetical protein
MKTASVKEIKQELENCSSKDLLELCLRLSKFKKENKELLTYLLFESSNESTYIENVKNELDQQFEQINTKSYSYIKKSVRSILTVLKRQIRYSNHKETEAELLMYFCEKMQAIKPTIENNPSLLNIYNRQILAAKKSIDTLHEDLQYDFRRILQNLQKNRKWKTII